MEVAEPGEHVIIDCNDGGRSLVNLPVAWRFTDYLNLTKVILRSEYVNATRHGNEPNVFINFNDQVVIRRATVDNRGQYKCYVDYELTTYFHLEVLNQRLTSIENFLTQGLMLVA